METRDHGWQLDQHISAGQAEWDMTSEGTHAAPNGLGVATQGDTLPEQGEGLRTPPTHSIGWEPGSAGKGYVTNDGEVHTWNTDDSGRPHHPEYMVGVPMRGEQLDRVYRQNRILTHPFTIGPDGAFSWTWDQAPGKPAPPIHPSDVDPRLTSLFNDDEPGEWHFGADNGWHVTESDFHPDDTFYPEIAGNPGRFHQRVVVGNYPTRELVVGQPGTHHGDLIHHHGFDFDAISQLDRGERQYYDTAENEPYQWTSDEGPVNFPTIHYGWIQNGGYGHVGPRPVGVTEALHAHGLLQNPDGSIVHDVKNDPWHFGGIEDGDSLQTSDPMSHPRPTAPAPAEGTGFQTPPGLQPYVGGPGKGLLLKDGTRYAWATDRFGDGYPHHAKALQALGIEDGVLDNNVKSYMTKYDNGWGDWPKLENYNEWEAKSTVDPFAGKDEWSFDKPNDVQFGNDTTSLAKVATIIGDPTVGNEMPWIELDGNRYHPTGPMEGGSAPWFHAQVAEQHNLDPERLRGAATFGRYRRDGTEYVVASPEGTDPMGNTNQRMQYENDLWHFAAYQTEFIPWQPGHPGKATLEGDKLHAWIVSDHPDTRGRPTHSDMMKHKGFGFGDGDFHIGPNGEVECVGTWGKNRTPQDAVNAAINADPRLKPFALPAEWSFSKVAWQFNSPWTAQVHEEADGVIEPDYITKGSRPILFDNNNKVAHIGPEHRYHSDLYRHLGVPTIPGGHQGRASILDNRVFSYDNTEQEALEAAAQALNEHEGHTRWQAEKDAEDDAFNFSHTAAVIPFPADNPSVQGTYDGDRIPFIYGRDSGNVHLGRPGDYHYQVDMAHEIPERKAYGMMYSTGKHEWYDHPAPEYFNPQPVFDTIMHHPQYKGFFRQDALSPDVRAQQARELDEKQFRDLPHGPVDEWDFTAKTAAAPMVVTPIDSENGDTHGQEVGHPYIYTPDTGKIYVGSNTSQHWDLIQHVPELQKSYDLESRDYRPPEAMTTNHQYGRVNLHGDHGYIMHIGPQVGDIHDQITNVLSNHFGQPLESESDPMWDFDGHMTSWQGSTRMALARVANDTVGKTWLDVVDGTVDRTWPSHADKVTDTSEDDDEEQTDKPRGTGKDHTDSRGDKAGLTTSHSGRGTNRVGEKDNSGDNARLVQGAWSLLLPDRLTPTPNLPTNTSSNLTPHDAPQSPIPPTNVDTPLDRPPTDLDSGAYVEGQDKPLTSSLASFLASLTPSDEDLMVDLGSIDSGAHDGSMDVDMVGPHLAQYEGVVNSTQLAQAEQGLTQGAVPDSRPSHKRMVRVESIREAIDLSDTGAPRPYHNAKESQGTPVENRRVPAEISAWKLAGDDDYWRDIDPSEITVSHGSQGAGTVPLPHRPLMYDVGKKHIYVGQPGAVHNDLHNEFIHHFQPSEHSWSDGPAAHIEHGVLTPENKIRWYGSFPGDDGWHSYYNHSDAIDAALGAEYGSDDDPGACPTCKGSGADYEASGGYYHDAQGRCKDCQGTGRIRGSQEAWNFSKVAMPWDQNNVWTNGPSAEPSPTDKWYYHGSPVRNRESILQNGIQAPNSGGLEWDQCQHIQQHFGIDPEALDDYHDMSEWHFGKTAGKLEWLESRPDKLMATDDGKLLFSILKERFHNPKTDPLFPWLWREARKGHLGYIDRNNLYFEGGAGGNMVVGPGQLNHMADWYADKRSPTRQGVDIMTLDTAGMLSKIQEYDEHNANRSVAERLNGGKVLKTLSNGWTVRELDPEDLDFEGAEMGHCVGGDGYRDAVRNGGTKIISLRDPKGLPHATMELEEDGWSSKTGENPWTIEQIQGKSNEIPKPEYQAMLKEWITSLPENERPKWKNSQDPITEIGEITGEDAGRYGEDGWGGYQPHGDYGIHTPPRPTDYEEVLEGIHNQNRSWRGDGEYDPAHGEALYEHALKRNEIPELAKAHEEYQSKAWDKLNEAEEYNHDFLGYPGESYEDDPERWDEMAEIEGKGETGRSLHEHAYENYTEARDELAEQIPQYQAAGHIGNMLAPHWNSQTGGFTNEKGGTFSSWNLG